MSESSGKPMTAGDYIGHHLTHWQNHDVKQTNIVDFSYFNIDTIFWAITLGVIGTFVMWRVAKRVHSGVPGRMQAAVEILLEMVDNQAKGIVKNAESRKMVGPLALTVFIWIFLMNSMDFLPVDLFERLFYWTGVEHSIKYFRIVPTADLSATLGMSCGVLLVCLYYNVKIKGFGGWVHELFSAPFGDKWFLYPVNFLMQMIEFAAKTVSHGLRLFGNMYAGELLFMLIALMGAVGFGSATGVSLFIGHVLAGTGWAIFHILIVALQAFIFMMLTLVYVGQAHDHH
ncbi:MAG: F0F1 ATP synthase subunit A [Polaromonas sp. 39-63-203]|jgi:F-type H+-transporting ATPase subunit a|uniref:F0F1 ATP synthase subunit A n=2 Tax=Polaromonas sp. TaxID=1869339 RepID=UPI000BD60812|nr:F0F1 ATP synthase subunit A [Polaromonas sp.]OYY51218.1 MAG: F0F1 ATP synthase subunit A [Polaromonas sp. 35-63-240]OYZ00533.1 MAG: F0F1 ATP synthase subunit A [Polaromonas sp. 28-63-22]OYZ83293.1 MAG: F0F1 ATP synthase subunit A [Polaromonas sp. 24-62-144]OZA95837.1 MAG: F0F1 ATP synthase subunit A [Polaromonas sp. 39-63-203]HQS33479.1 F0F1 ATP synthase subunit A [Polaromonas sp.]